MLYYAILYCTILECYSLIIGIGGFPWYADFPADLVI